MALKFKFTAKDEIPEAQRALYVERDGSWLLDVEGVAEKSKLDEFRTNNIALSNEIKELKQRFEGIDPDEVRKLAEAKRALEEQQALKAGEFEKVLDARLKSVKADHEKQLTALTSEREVLNSRLTAIQIDQAVVSEATKRGLRATALEDITARARKIFTLAGGAPRALEADGQTVRGGRDGVTPLSIAEWVETLVSDAPHLFEGSAGGGAVGHGSGGAATRKNPFRKGAEWNVTEQMRLLKTDPALAARLQATA